MKKTLIAVALLSLSAANAEAHGGGWNGHYHGYHGYYGASNFWWGAAFGAALTLPFYYAYSRPDPGPYYYYSSPQVVYTNPPVYVQSQPVYVQSQPTYAATMRPRTVVAQAPNNGVTELGPVDANNPPPVALTNPAEPVQPQPDQAGKWFVYPGRGQTQAQLNSDRGQCNAWAVGQTGYDPDLKVHRNPETGPIDYGRALSACLEGRGYTVR